MNDVPMLAELDVLLAAERDLPVAESLRASVWDRLCKTFGWTTGGGGGSSGSAGGLGLLHALIAVVLVSTIGGVAYVAATGSDAPGSSFAAPSTRGMSPRGSASLGPDRPTPFDEPSRPSRGIAGRVVYAGAPVEGARVVLISYATLAGIASPLEVTSGRDGRFDLGVHAATTYDVTATADGKGYAHARVNVQDPLAKTENVLLDMSGCDHVLEGEVRDTSGGVIAGAEVLPSRGVAFDITTVAAPAISDAKGRYRLCVRAGAITVIARAAGYGAIMIDEDVFGRRRLDIDLVPEAIVAGRAVRADNGEPVADAKVWLRPANWPRRVHTTPAVAITSADGRFRFASVAPGQHVVWIGNGDLAGWTRLAATAGENGELLVRLEARPMISGRVVDQAGHAVSGAQVVTRTNGWRSGVPVTADAGGAFTLFGKLDETVALDVIGYEVLEPREYRVDGSRTPVIVKVRKRGVIRGRVARDGRPAPYATISVNGALPEYYGRPAPADAYGNFELVDLPAGTYGIGASSDALQAFTATGGVQVTVADGEVTEGVVLELDGSASISGVVVDQDDHAVAGAFVQYVHERTGDLCRAITADDGSFRCGMMTGGGRYRPVVRPSRDSEVHFAGVDPLPAVELADARSDVLGQVLRVRFARARIEGRVVRSGGAPYPDVSVAALESSVGSPPANAYWARGGRVSTDGDGRFSVEVWNDTAYALYARAPAGAEATARDVRAGARDVVIVLDDQGSIRGKVTGFARRPTIVVRRVGNADEALWPRFEGDGFVIDHLAPGPYVVFAMVDAQAAAEPVEIRSGQTSVVAVDARAPATFAGRVVDFLTGAPVAGVRCSVGPYHPGAGIFGYGTMAAPSDADGRFFVEAMSGTVGVDCLGSRGLWSEGSAQVVAAPGATVEVTVHVITAEPAWTGIGARIEMTQPDTLGFGHVVAELRPGGTGESAGLRVGDAIVAIQGRAVSTLTDIGLDRLIRTHALGTTINITVSRDGRERVIAVVLEGTWER